MSWSWKTYYRYLRLRSIHRYEYTARSNVTNGTVNLAAKLIKNLECETRVSRVVLRCGAFATGNSANRNWISFVFLLSNHSSKKWMDEREHTTCGTMNQCFRTRDKIRTKFPPYGKINGCNPYGEDSVSRTINFIVHCLQMNRRSLRKNEPLSIIHVHFKNYQPSVPTPDNHE